MSIVKHYINEIGLNIVLDCEEEIPEGSVTKMEVLLPNGKRKTWTSTILTVDEESRYLIYTTADSDLIQAGEYKIQAYIKQTDGNTIVWETLGETAVFTVYNRFN
jgi:hypothetical protein